MYTPIPTCYKRLLSSQIIVHVHAHSHILHAPQLITVDRVLLHDCSPLKSTQDQSIHFLPFYRTLRFERGSFFFCCSRFQSQYCSAAITSIPASLLEPVRRGAVIFLSVAPVPIKEHHVDRDGSPGFDQILGHPGITNGANFFFTFY